MKTRNSNPPFRRRLSAVAAALLLASSPPAFACDCSICKSLPQTEAARVDDFHRQLEEFTREAAQLQLALAKGDAAQVNEQLLAMVKKWLTLHNRHYTSGPGEAATGEWQQRMVSINRLVAEAFRDGREGRLAEVREKAGELDAMLRNLDESVGAPSWHVAMLDLRNTLELSLGPDAQTGDAEEWMEARLHEASSFWESLPESRRPDDPAGEPLDIARHIATLLETPQDRRPEAAATALAFLDGHLAAFRERIGGAETRHPEP